MTTELRFKSGAKPAAQTDTKAHSGTVRLSSQGRFTVSASGKPQPPKFSPPKTAAT